jgi:hypothetical protein
LEKKMLRGVVTRCMKYDCGMRAMKTKAMAAWKTHTERWMPRKAPSPSPDGEHGLPQDVADGRPRRPRRLDHGEPARLHDKAGGVDHEEDEEGIGELRRGIDPGRPRHEAAPAGHAEAHDEEESEHVEYELVEKVESALEQLDVEEGESDVVVDGSEHGADEEGEEAPEDDGVHDAG